MIDKVHTLFLLLRIYLGSVRAVNQMLLAHPAWSRLDSYECGESASDRIIGGTNAALGQFPWIVRLGYVHENEDSAIDWMCGGTLISDRHVVTAAHCILSDDHDVQLKYVRFGEHNVLTNPDCELSICAPPVQDIEVESFSKHSYYNKPPFHNDIAMIKLKSPVEFNDYVSPICLPRAKDQLAGVDVGDIVVTAGWGTTNMSTAERANKLQVVAIRVVQASMCNLFGKEFKVLESEICAGAQLNKDSCDGDSGGPLMKVYDTIEGPKNVLVGVVSFGSSICGIRKPAVYSSVVFFLQWILDNIT